MARDVEQLRSQVTQLEARDLAQQKQSTGETEPKQQHLAAKASETTSLTSYDDEASDDSIGKSLQALKAKMQRMRASSRNEQHASSSKQQLSSDSASKLTPLTQFTDSHIQNGAAVPLTEGIKKNVHANPESCLRPRQDRKPTEDDYDCLEREIKELEKRESQRIAARKQAIKKAYDATSDEACDEYASPRKKAGCMKAHKQLAWRQAKDKYERAALTDIVNSDHSQDFRNVNDVAFKATQQEILHNKKLAEEFSGKKEYSQLNKQAEKSEQLRSTAEKSAMTLLRTEKHELEKVHREEMQDLEAKDHKKQAAKTEIVMNHVAKDGDRELYLNPLDESSSTKSTLDHSDAVADGIKAEENAEAHPEISVSSHSQRELSAARNIEQRRQKAFHEEVSALRKADRGVRAKAASSPTSLSHLSQYEKDEQAAMLKSLHATDQEQARRAKEIQKLRVRTAADQKAADAKADQALARAQVESGYRAIGLVSPPVSSSLKMSDDYHADVALASAEDSKRQSAWRAKRQDEISKEGRADAQRQAAASEQTESALRDQNHAAGYSETKVDNAVADALAEHERPAPKALPVQTARHSAEAATSETVPFV